MKKQSFKLPKWAVMLVAACIFIPLSIDWFQPGDGLHLAAVWLGGAKGVHAVPTWGMLVRFAGSDLGALTAISVGAGLVCTWFVAAIVAMIFDAAIRRADAGGVGKHRLDRNVSMVFAVLAFALTPGFLAGATRISPLMVWLVPYLAAVWMVVCVLCGGLPFVATNDRVNRKKRAHVRLLSAALLAFPVALLLVLYSEYDRAFVRQALRALAFPAVYVWLAVGIAPALLIAWRVRKQRLSGWRARLLAFGIWAVMIAVTGATNVTLGTFKTGRVAGRVVSHIIAAAEKHGRIAVVGDGPLDDLFCFMMPEKLRLVSSAREKEPAYSGELADWVRNAVRTNSAANGGVIDDLVFAAELGPGALIDEWMKIDRVGFESLVASVENLFPTRLEWEAACDEVKSMRLKEPLGDYIRHLLATSGNSLGCRLLEGGHENGEREAWEVFKLIVDAVEPENYAAFLNLEGMVRRGYGVPQDVAEDLVTRRETIEKSMKGWPQAVRAARRGGRIYMDPEERAKFERKRSEQRGGTRLSPEQARFVQTFVDASKDLKHGRAAQAAIRDALIEGRVRPEMFGAPLVTLDLALGDVANAEKDAREVLKSDRHDPTANAALGLLAATRGDYASAERYLRRAIATGRASAAAVNDLAYVCCRLGQLEEAEELARKAVKQNGEYWPFRETLASVLIRKGKFDEGERELAKVEYLVAQSNVPRNRIASIELDHARLLKAKGDRSAFEAVLRKLGGRKDLTGAERKDLATLGKEAW